MCALRRVHSSSFALAVPVELPCLFVFNYEKMNKIPGGLTGPPPRPVLAYETLTALLRAAIRIELSKEARTLLRTHLDD